MMHSFTPDFKNHPMYYIRKVMVWNRLPLSYKWHSYYIVKNIGKGKKKNIIKATLISPLRMSNKDASINLSKRSSMMLLYVSVNVEGNDSNQDVNRGRQPRDWGSM